MPTIRAKFEPYRYVLAEKICINEIGANNRQAGDWVELLTVRMKPWMSRRG